MIQLLLAAAAVLLVASLPISQTGAGKALRRWALVCFVLALAPAVLFGLGRSAGVAPTPSSVGNGPDGISELLGLLLLAPVAYCILAIRRRFKPKSRDAWADYLDRRAVGKKPVDPKAPHVGASGPAGLFGGTP